MCPSTSQWASSLTIKAICISLNGANPGNYRPLRWQRFTDNRRLLIADMNGGRVRIVTLSTGILTAVAGNGTDNAPGEGAIALGSPRRSDVEKCQCRGDSTKPCSVLFVSPVREVGNRP